MKLRRPDILLLSAILLAAVLLWAFFALRSSGPQLTVIVQCDGEEIASYPLSEDREELLTTPYGINRVKIEGGKVRVTEADCPDKLCVYHPAASRSGEMIVCLPHKLVVQIEDGKTDPALPDGVAR